MTHTHALWPPTPTAAPAAARGTQRSRSCAARPPPTWCCACVFVFNRQSVTPWEGIIKKTSRLRTVTSAVFQSPVTSAVFPVTSPVIRSPSPYSSHQAVNSDHLRPQIIAGIFTRKCIMEYGQVPNYLRESLVSGLNRSTSNQPVPKRAQSIAVVMGFCWPGTCLALISNP